MKSYEAVETSRTFDFHFPVYARIDGRSFSKFTRHMNRPFDERMSSCMIETTKYLVERTHAVIGYVQSDEISLAWDGSTENNKLFFAGKVQKSCSVLASKAAAKFAVEYTSRFGTMSTEFPHFDCRVIQMPSRTETANMFLWREFDAQKNSISMAARKFFSHKELQNKTGVEMIEMMAKKGISLDQFPVSFRRGTWVKRVLETRSLNFCELNRIPSEHRPDPETLVTRTTIKELDMPSFVTVKNREDVIFNDAHPIF